MEHSLADRSASDLLGPAIAAALLLFTVVLVAFEGRVVAYAGVAVGAGLVVLAGALRARDARRGERTEG